MTLQVAKEAVSKFIDASWYRINVISESKNYFVFAISSVNGDVKHRITCVPAIGVNKKTGEIAPFDPLQHRGEMTSMKRLTGV